MTMNFVRQLLILGCVFSVNAFCSENALQSYPASGTLFPMQKTKITSQVAGRVNEILVGTGDEVVKGQILAKIDSAFIEMDVQKLENAKELAKLSYEDAKTNFIRMKNLWEKHDGEKSSIPKRQYEEARSHLKHAALLQKLAILNWEQMKQRLEETSIRAPYDGVITDSFVDIGEAVSSMPPNPLFEIMDLSQLVLEFSLPQKFLERVQTGHLVQAELEGYSGSIQGGISSVQPRIDPTNRSFICRVIINNENRSLKPGLFVTAKVQLK